MLSTPWLFGNVFITFQPSRGWEDAKNYHDLSPRETARLAMQREQAAARDLAAVPALPSLLPGLQKNPVFRAVRSLSVPMKASLLL